MLRAQSRGIFECAGEAGDALDPVAAAPGFQAPGEALGGARVGVAGRAYLDGCGSGEEELDRVLRGDNAAHAQNRDVDGAGRFVDHAQGDGLDSRAG